MAKVKKPQRNRRPWTQKEINLLRARAGTHTIAQVATTLRRSLAAVSQYAMRAGISYRAA